MKLLKEVYKKYHPETDQFADLMELGTVLSSKADKDNRLLESVVSFPRVIPKRTLYALEEELRIAYDLNSVRLLPKYEESQFDEKYIADLVMETERTGIVARGFFGNYRYRLDGDKLTFEVPFSDGGVYLLEDAKTHEVMENIRTGQRTHRIRACTFFQRLRCRRRRPAGSGRNSGAPAYSVGL